MEQHDILFKPIKTNDIVILARDENPKKKSSKPFIRQIIVCSSVWVSFFLGGLCFGAPTVVIPQLRKEAGSDDAVSQEMASWISSVYGFASVPWIIIIPLLSGRIGRKYPFLAVSIVCFTSSIYFYCSNSAEQILIAQILQSAIYGCTITISIAIVAEYASPNYRGMFLCFQPATGYWGIWIANALGTWFHWSTIPILGIICSLYNIVTTLLWCESPAWLASAGKYEECAKAHRWLRGENAESEKELASLIGSCKQNLDKHDREKKRKRNVLKELCNTITRKQFYMPLLLAIAVLLLYQTSETKDKTLQEIEEYFIDERVNPSECQPMAEYGMDLTK
ncbi:sugar transporter domain-containing protein [Phthorimaea operculella]|nr:sugar transporter domain-containing protein [Phthorimaea operculella]